jgi:hypothetical protein
MDAAALGPRCRRLLDYWREIRLPEERVTERDRFDPTAVPSLLAHIHLMEWHSPSDVRYRLSGTEEVARLGGDPKGCNYLDAVDPEAGTYLSAYFFQIMQHPAGIHIATEETYSGGAMRHTRFIALPLLRHATGEHFTICVVEADERLSEPTMVNPEPGIMLWWDRVVAADLLDLGHGLPAAPPYRAKQR